MNERAIDGPPPDVSALRPLLRRALGLDRGTVSLPLERAEIELMALHRREQARLLEDAARLVAAGSPRDVLHAWRRRAREALRLARADGVPTSRLLARCSILGEWPSAEALALSARRFAGRA